MPKQTILGHSGFGAKLLPTERRVHTRYACPCAIALQALRNRKAELWHPAYIENFSAKGMALVCATFLERGTLLFVKLEGDAQRFCQPLLARVVRISERPGGVWRIGCKFAIPLDEDEISVLLRADKTSQASRDQLQAAEPGKQQKAPAVPHDPFLDGSTYERRRVHRRRLSATVVLSYGADCRESMEAFAVDGSLRGLHLLSRKSFGLDTILRVRSSKASRTVPSVEVRVKSCRLQQTGWRIGVQFVKPPSADVMLSLG
jgi:hypothetical protein